MIHNRDLHPDDASIRLVLRPALLGVLDMHRETIPRANRPGHVDRLEPEARDQCRARIQVAAEPGLDAEDVTASCYEITEHRVPRCARIRMKRTRVEAQAELEDLRFRDLVLTDACGITDFDVLKEKFFHVGSLPPTRFVDCNSYAA